MKTWDLIPNQKKLETLFIMESPFSTELEQGIPCSGDSGKRMAFKIFGDAKKSFGEVLSNESNITSHIYGIMSTFPFPLEIEDDLTDEQKHYCSLKRINCKENEVDRFGCYRLHFDILEDTEQLESMTNFCARLKEYCQNCPNLKNIVFNGFIAQSVLLIFKDLLTEYPPYKKLFFLNISEYPKNILFVNHPSPYNESWEFQLSQLQVDNSEESWIK